MLVQVGFRGSLLDLQHSSYEVVTDYLQRMHILLYHARTTSIIICTPENSPKRMREQLNELARIFPNHASKMNCAIEAVKKSINITKDLNRFIEESEDVHLQKKCNCPIDLCRFIVNISSEIKSDKCEICGQKQNNLSSWLSNNEFIPITRYSQEFVTKQWDKKRFFTDIWEPMFRHAKRVEIYDPHVTWALSDAKVDSHEGDLPDQYTKGVQWICESFGAIRKKNNCDTGGIITFYGEISYKHAKEHTGFSERYIANENLLLQVGKVFRTRCNLDAIEIQFGIRVRLEVNLYGKDDPPETRMRHNRYVQTDQAVLAIDRGVAAMPQNGRLGFTDVILLSPAAGKAIAAGIEFKPTSAERL